MADREPARILVGTVVGSGGSATLNINGSEVQAAWGFGYTPVHGDVLRVLWVDGLATAIAQLGTSPVDGAPPPAPPSSTSTGVLVVPAGWSGSYRPSPYSKWESGDVKQDAYGGGVAYEGLWGGYSQAKLKSLQGKTITKTQLRIGKRLRIGSFNSSLTLRVFRSSTTGKGNPNTADGPYTDSIPANASARWITLSNSLGNALKDGGSVSIQGGSYGGVQGRSGDAQSGTLRIYWKKV